MHDLTPITALGGIAGQVTTAGTVSCSENPGLALASVHARSGQETAAGKRLRDLTGTVPGIGKAVLQDPVSGFWTGPDQWMIMAPFASHEDLAGQMQRHFGDTASVTEQTDAWCCFDLNGARTEAVMELLCNINFRAMKPGDAIRTPIHHMSCFVIRLEPSDNVRLLGPRSSAGSLHHAVVTAMKAVQ